MKAIYAGDVIVCPASSDGAHKIINSSQTEKLTYLDCSTLNSPEIVHYPNSDKVGIIINGESNTLFKNSTQVDYYEGE
jgi:uncharacterized cupin superfamily protein